MKSISIFSAFFTFALIWTISKASSVCNLDFDTTYGSYACQEKQNEKTCQVFCENGQFSSPPADKYTCYASENKWYPAEVPICGPKKSKCGDGLEYTCNEQDARKVCPKIVENEQRNKYHEICGCHCIGSNVQNSEGECVPKTQCDCEYNGNKYEVGEKIKFGAINFCTCLRTGWACSQNTATCIAWGDPHYVTFDGKKFDFMGKCSYYLLKTDSFSIAGNNIAWKGGKIVERELTTDEYNNLLSVTLSVTIRMKESVITLGRDKISQLIVNGYVINEFPYYEFMSGIWIRKEAENLLVAYLPNGIKVTYQYEKCTIVVPPDFNLEHGGLCGTLNKNPEDDFQKSDGILTDNVNQFGNSWKTETSCLDNPHNNNHPCDGNPIRKAQAKISCSFLKSQIFQRCFAKVPVKSYYDACVYDMCACGDNAQDCLCPAIQSYSDECTRAKIIINWRSYLHTCKTKCPNGMVWNTCNNPCELSCHNKKDRNCVKSCAAGCACPEGKILDEDGNCIPADQCKCWMNEKYYNPGSTKIFTKEICTCQDARWECMQSSDDDIKKQCAKLNMVFTDCYAKEIKTCDNTNDPELNNSELASISITCSKGCICKDGSVLNAHTGLCVAKDSCPKCEAGKMYICTGFNAYLMCPATKQFISTVITPIGKEWCGCYCSGKNVLNNDYKCVPINQCNCFEDGKLYKPNERIHDCTCENGLWKCSDKTASCSAWGDPHYKTFDGRTFDFMGKCSYYLVKTDDYSIEGNNAAWQNGKILEKKLTTEEFKYLPSATLSITIRMNNSVITIGKNTITKLVVNDEDINIFPYTDWNSGITIRKESDNKLAAYLPNGIKVTYSYYKWNIITSAPFQGQHGGLCGIWNKDPKDDFTKPDGELTMDSYEFGNSWKTDKFCLDNQYYMSPVFQTQNNAEKCSILYSSVFANCHSFVDVDTYYKGCLYDTSTCSEKITNCLCPAVDSYADECGLWNIFINWRSKVKECQIQCPKGLVYNPCNNPCERSCDEIASDTSCISSCVAGCGCPKGQTFDRDGKTCNPIEQCECREDDKLLPVNSSKVTNLHGALQICTCKKGKWFCTEASNEEAKKVCKQSGKVLVDCVPLKEKTCINLNEAKMTTKKCHKGCACAKDYVWDEKNKICINVINCPQCSKDKVLSCKKSDALKVCPGASQFIPNFYSLKNEEWCGCHCTGHNLLNTDGKCVPKHQCLCVYNGQGFKPGEKIQIGNINECLCENGKWKCSQNTGSCTGWGDPHYTSFDGKKFDFMGKCSYYLIKSTDYSIEGNNIAWKNGKIVWRKLTDTEAKYYPSLTLSITIRIKYHEITIGRDQVAQLIVNGNEIKEFPYSNDIAGVTVRKEGDTLLAAYLSNGIKVTYSRGKWNIITPQNFNGIYGGLCGILNRNPKDDFTKPDGTITEDIYEFGNSWRTDSSCPNTFSDNRHPCDKNVYQRAFAISKCNILKQNLFQNCHSFVDVQAYYEGCLYDTCSCGSNINNCLCTAIQSYADECGNYKIGINWATEVEECKPQCPKNMIYDACYDPYTRTCAAISEGRTSPAYCVAGCKCPKGKTLNERNECVPVSSCKCKMNDSYYPPGSIEVIEIDKKGLICTCKDAKWNCKKSSEDDLEKICKKNGQVFSNCVPEIIRTCYNLDEYIPQPEVCRKGCVCPEYWVMDESKKKCVKEESCNACSWQEAIIRHWAEINAIKNKQQQSDLKKNHKKNSKKNSKKN